MRILQVTSSNQRRGAEVAAFQLGEELAARGHDVRTVGLAAAEAPESLPYATLAHRRWDPRLVAHLSQLASRADVVCAHGGTTLIPAALAARIAGKPLVYRNIGDPEYWGDVPLAAVRVGLPLRSAARVVTLYQRAGSFLERRYGVDHERIDVISNAVAEQQFPRRTVQAASEARARYELPAHGTVIGFLGAMSAEKRPQWAIEIAESVRADAVAIAGDGPLRPMLAQQARARSIPVHVLGAVSDPATFLAALDVLVVPSTTEGVPGVVIEAALVGVPVVGTDVGGVGETLQMLGSGTSVPPELASMVAAVREVLARPEEFLADRSTVVERHGIASVADRWAETLSASCAAEVRRR